MITGYPALADVDHMYLLIESMCDRYYPLLSYKVLNTPEEVIDEVHDEVLSRDKVWDPIVSLRAYVIPAEQAFPMNVFTIEELRDVVLQVSAPSLITAGLASQDATTQEVTLGVKVGDRFWYTESMEYDVLTWKIGQTFGSTDVPTFFVANCVKVRRVATAYEGL